VFLLVGIYGGAQVLDGFVHYPQWRQHNHVAISSSASYSRAP
jgi:hypothetical protein